MIDGVLLENGQSRAMRATLPATYEEFAQSCAAGTQLLDIMFNTAGWQTLPTFLNKQNLLQDPTAAQYGLTGGAVPNDILAILGKSVLSLNGEYFLPNGEYVPIIKVAEGTYIGTGTYGADSPNSIALPSHNEIIAAYVAGSNSSQYEVTFFNFTSGQNTARVKRYYGSPGADISFYNVKYEISDTTLTWYNPNASRDGQDQQLNTQGLEYSYLILYR